MKRDPALIIADPKYSRLPAIPAATDPDVTRWCTQQGALGALSHCVNEERWLHVLGVASFNLDVGQNVVVAVPHAGASREMIADEFRRTVWPTYLQIRGLEVLHGSAIIGPRGIVAFCAASETGKSTLAYALSRRGYGLWADDAVVLLISDDSVQTRSLPVSLRLRKDSALYFGYPGRRPTRVAVCKRQRNGGVLPVAAICLLERVSGWPHRQFVSVQEVGAIEALLGVLERALYFSLQDRDRKRQMIKQYLSLVGQVTVYKLSFCSGFDWLQAVLDEIEQRILGRSRQSSIQSA